MAKLITLLLIGLSVGLGNFAAAVAIGLGGVSQKLRLRIAVVFGLFETGMPVVGLVIGQGIAAKLGGHANLIGGALLGLTGVYLLIGALRQSAKAKKIEVSQNWGKLVLAGLSLSIDNLIIGFGLGTRHQSVWLATAVIGVTSIVLSLAGLELGSRLGSKAEEYSEILSGSILVLVGVLLALKIL